MSKKIEKYQQQIADNLKLIETAREYYRSSEVVRLENLNRKLEEKIRMVPFEPSKRIIIRELKELGYETTRYVKTRIIGYHEITKGYKIEGNKVRLVKFRPETVERIMEIIQSKGVDIFDIKPPVKVTVGWSDAYFSFK